MKADVHRLSMAHPGDVSALAELIAAGAVRPEAVVAVLGKTEGNGGVNDFTRGFFVQSLMGLLASHLNESAEDLARRIPCVLSGGTEGVLSPHYLVFCRAEGDEAAGAEPALAVGTAFSPVIEARHVGTRMHALAVAQAVRDAIADARIEDPDEVHLVQVKCPCLTSDRIAALVAEGQRPPAGSAKDSMAKARAAGALGVALALGEIGEEAVRDEALLADFSLQCDRASISSGVEVLANEVIVLGNSRRWSGPLRVAHRPMRDALDIRAVAGVLADLGLGGDIQLDEGFRARVHGVLVKAEPDRRGRVRGQRHTMLNDTDIDPQRHIRGAVGGLVAGVMGDTRIFVSGGAEHQGPDGGGLIAVVARTGAEAPKTLAEGEV